MLVTQAEFSRINNIKPQSITDLLKSGTLVLNGNNLIDLEDIKNKEYMEKRATNIPNLKSNISSQEEPILVQRQKVELEIKITQLASEKIKLSKLRNELISREYTENIIFKYLEHLNSEIESRGETIVETIIDASLAQKGRENKINKAKILFKTDLKKIIKKTKQNVERIIKEGNQ